MIKGVTAELTSEELMDMLTSITVPISKINTIAEVVTDPRVEKRMLFSEDPVTGTRISLAPPPHMTSFLELNTRQLSFPPRFGEHNEEVLGRKLGYSGDALRDLQERKII